MEVMKFIFSGFWIWLGTLILVCGTLNGVAEIVKAFRKQRSVKVTNFKDGMSFVEVTGLAAEDYEWVIKAAKDNQDIMMPLGDFKEQEGEEPGEDEDDTDHS